MSRMSELNIQITEMVESGVWFEDIVNFLVKEYNYSVSDAENIVYDIEAVVTIEQEAKYHDMMDGDHQSALTSVGWGTDEDYGYFGDYE